MTMDKRSVEDCINPVEAQEDSEFIIITQKNKEDIAELCLTFLTCIRREVSNQQKEQIAMGKAVLKQALLLNNSHLKLLADNILFQSTNNAKRYKELSKIVSKLDSDREITIDDLTQIVDGLERY